ncbi:hypothetical protein Yalta_166 [Yalta virus]|nr:hypothetical protein Yalta_166 [Yalta virus]
MASVNLSKVFESSKDYKDLIQAFGDINFDQYVKLKTKKEIEYIPSFMASSANTLTITNVSKNKYEKIKNILSFYTDHDFEIKEDDDDLIITKQEKKIKQTYPISKVTIPDFNETFESKKIFDPIVIDTDNKTCLGSNFEILIKSFISDPNIFFEEDIDFPTLKNIFNLRGEDDYVMKKKDIQKLQTYCQTFNIFDYVDSERLRVGVLSGITDFRIGNTLYDVRNRSSITTKDFIQLYIYAFMLHEIMDIKINTLVIISPILGEEYIMKFEIKPEYTTFIKNYKF